MHSSNFGHASAYLPCSISAIPCAKSASALEAGGDGGAEGDCAGGGGDGGAEGGGDGAGGCGRPALCVGAAPGSPAAAVPALIQRTAAHTAAATRACRVLITSAP